MRLVLLLVAAVIAVGAGVFALQWSGKQQVAPATQSAPVARAAEPSSVATVDVLVAKQPINVGTVIDDSMVDKQPWPEHLVLEGFVTSADKDTKLIGRVARANFLAREPFIAAKLANPNDPSFLAAALPEGMRAVTLATDAVSGVAGYVFPGDRVDILFTHNVPAEAKEMAHPNALVRVDDKPAYTEVLAHNVRVLAINVREAAGKEAAQNNTTPSSVTVELDSQTIQRLRLAEKQGGISLALRSIKDINNNDEPGPTSLADLTHVDSTTAPTSGGVRIIRGVGVDSVAMGAVPPPGPGVMPYGMPQR